MVFDQDAGSFACLEQLFTNYSCMVLSVYTLKPPLRCRNSAFFSHAAPKWVSARPRGLFAKHLPYLVRHAIAEFLLILRQGALQWFLARRGFKLWLRPGWLA